MKVYLVTVINRTREQIDGRKRYYNMLPKAKQLGGEGEHFKMIISKLETLLINLENSLKDLEEIEFLKTNINTKNRRHGNANYRQQQAS